MGFLKNITGAKRRALFTLGGAVALAGAVLLAGALYFSLVDGDGDSDPEGPAVVDLEKVDLDIVPADAQPTAAAEAPAPPLPLVDAGYRIVIDKLGVDAPVSTFGMDEELVPEVPYTATDVAWYDFSARPGTGGNAVFAGHVTWNGRAVFYDLDQLQAGDQITLAGQDGTQLTYTVSDVWQVDPEDPDSLKVMWPTESDVITLITCSGKFIDTDDPVLGGDYTHRLVVRGNLIAINQPAAAGG